MTPEDKLLNGIKLFLTPFHIELWAADNYSNKVSGPGYGRLLENFITEYILLGEHNINVTVRGRDISVILNGYKYYLDITNWMDQLMEDPHLPIYPTGADVMAAVNRLKWSENDL